LNITKVNFEIIAAYFSVSGFRPVTQSTDSRHWAEKCRHTACTNDALQWDSKI